MLSPARQRQLLLVIAAIVLLLQSFAVWHDATHPFHSAEVQCERLNAINHFPATDLLPEVMVHQPEQMLEIVVPAYTFLLSNHTRQHHAIRAPPAFS